MDTWKLPSFKTEEELESRMSEPTAAVVEEFRKNPGDLAILGIGGKIGVTLGMMAARARDAAGVRSRILGVSRFSDKAARARLEKAGVECLECDLLDRSSVDKLPDAPRVVLMADRKSVV